MTCLIHSNRLVGAVATEIPCKLVEGAHKPTLMKVSSPATRADEQISPLVRNRESKPSTSTIKTNRSLLVSSQIESD